MKLKATLLSVVLGAFTSAFARCPVDESYLELVKWRSIGPSRGGRVVAVAGDSVNPAVMYASLLELRRFPAVSGARDLRSFDDGGTWQRLRNDFPVVPVHDLIVKDGDLVVATHGRSFWILDNVALLNQYDLPGRHGHSIRLALRARDGTEVEA